MRGGDRLVNECSWMSGICFSFYHSTYCCGDFKRSPPLISLFCQSVPKCRLPKNPASPRGKPRTQKPLAATIQRSALLREGGFAARVAKLATPTVGCAKLEAYTIQRTTPPQLRVRSVAFNRGMIATGNHNFERFAALCNTPEVEPRRLRREGHQHKPLTLLVFERVVTGRVRELPYSYNPRSVVKKRRKYGFNH